MTVLITLTIAGSDTGPFDLYSDADGFVVPFENNVPKASLVSGYTSSLVPGGTVVIRVTSDSVCTNFIDLLIGTTSTTTTATPPIAYQYNLYGYADSPADACAQSGASWVSFVSPPLQVFAASPTPGGVISFFNDSSLLVPFNDPAAYFKYLSYSLSSDSMNLYSAFYNDSLGLSSWNDCTP